MKLITLEQKQIDNFIDFNDFWSEKYDYPNIETYDNILEKKEFSELDLEKIFQWKNGMTLSEAKKSGLDKKIISKRIIINELKLKFNEEEFEKEFNSLTAVWKIFLRHIIKPCEYPIYDQNIHRAYCFINNDENWINITSTINDKKKQTFYFNDYKPFVIEKQRKYNLKLRKIDKAFFAFGQILNNNKKFFRTKLYVLTNEHWVPYAFVKAIDDNDLLKQVQSETAINLLNGENVGTIPGWSFEETDIEEMKKYKIDKFRENKN